MPVVRFFVADFVKQAKVFYGSRNLVKYLVSEMRSGYHRYHVTIWVSQTDMSYVEVICEFYFGFSFSAEFRAVFVVLGLKLRFMLQKNCAIM